jgi:formamidopyrimidine-DNA glycosylase
LEAIVPELPEVANRAAEMHASLCGRTIIKIEILQPKCLNLSSAQFRRALVGARVIAVSSRGKWIFVETTGGWLLLNLGMGGEILLVPCSKLPEKWRLCFHLDDGRCFAVNFWWFGYAHFVEQNGLPQHKMTAKLGPDALTLSADALYLDIRGRRARVKSYLLNQSNLAGIGNAYVHDILFLARLHPLRTLDTLTRADVDRLWEAIQAGLLPSLKLGGAHYELDLFGEPGGFSMDNVLIGYREGLPCPSCGREIEKIKTGTTSSFICASCQPLPS